MNETGKSCAPSIVGRSAKTIMHAWKVGHLNAAWMRTHSFLASSLGPPTLVNACSDIPAATCGGAVNILTKAHLAVGVNVQHLEGLGRLLGRQEVLQVLLDDVVPGLQQFLS